MNIFKTGVPKSAPLKRLPIKDIANAMIISHLFESSNFLRMPIKTKDKPANVKTPQKKNINPP